MSFALFMTLVTAVVAVATPLALLWTKHATFLAPATGLRRHRESTFVGMGAMALLTVAAMLGATIATR